MRILNRAISWTDDCIFCEADQRHIEVVTGQLQLQAATEISTPGAPDEQLKSLGEATDEMAPAEASKYRVTTARLNYLAMGRPDIQ